MIELGSKTAIPVTILTGFLGAGKTTLLNRILTGNHGLRVAVLVNDFGSVNVDAEMIVGIEEDVMSLANGCVCCSIRDDLVETIEQILERPEKPEYVVLEASGVSDPASLAMTFTDARFHDLIRLDSIMCLVDAEQHDQRGLVVDLANHCLALVTVLGSCAVGIEKRLPALVT